MPKTIHVPNQGVNLVAGILQRRVDEYDEDLERDCSRCAEWGGLCVHHGDIAFLKDLVNEVIIQLT